MQRSNHTVSPAARALSAAASSDDPLLHPDGRHAQADASSMWGYQQLLRKMVDTSTAKGMSEQALVDLLDQEISPPPGRTGTIR